MNTFHKIVLAIAGSLNDGISSPAPQGNRALRNKTTALADRQAQASAKTPPLLHRIGKGIGKFWIPILLAIATALTTSIEQAQAATLTPEQIEARREALERVARTTRSARTNQVSTNRIIIRGTPTARPASRTPIQPAAVPPPLLAPAAPVIKKAVLHVGTYLVCAVGEWFIGRQMDKLTKAEVDKAADQSASCGVESILWESNSTKITRIVNRGSFHPSWYLPGTMSARQGQEDTPASGTWYSGTAMTEAEAESQLYHARGTIIHASYELINSRGRKYAAAYVRARKDAFDSEKRKVLAYFRRTLRDSTYNYNRLLDKETREYKVGSYRVTSDFDDPHPRYEKLARPGEDKRAHSYEATVTWKMQPLLANGTWGNKIDMEHTFRKGATDNKGDLRLPAYKDNSFAFDFCESNQKITDIECGDSITRRVMDRDITEIKHVRVPDLDQPNFGIIPMKWELQETKIGTERVVVHDEN